MFVGKKLNKPENMQPPDLSSVDKYAKQRQEAEKSKK